MKIAIATDGTEVSHHFGKCALYTIVEIDEKEILKKEIVKNPGHEPGFLPLFLSNLGVNFILSGGMGPRAINLFREKGVEPVVGVSGNVDNVITNFVNGNLEVGESDCDHGEGHDCDHN